MRSLRLQTAILALLLAAGAVGCTHKKPVLVAPQQPPPAAAPEPSPTPEPAQPVEQQQAEPQQTEQQPEQQPAPAEQTKTSPARPKTKNGGTTARKPATAAQKPASEVARTTPPKKVIPAEKNEPTPPAGGQISPGPSPADASSQASTEQLLQSAESNLNGLNRQLSKDEEAMKAQIREFINLSRKATTENDPARAHNFAVKARLLSDALVKQR